MRSAFDLAEELRKSAKTPALISKAVNKLRSADANRMSLRKDQVMSVAKISHFLYAITAEHGRVLVSLVFNPEDVLRFEASDFSAMSFAKTYGDIWYEMNLA